MRKKSIIVNQQQEQIACAFCNQPAQMMCGRCKQVYYCKVDHQKNDWKRHMKECKSYDQKRVQHLQNKRMRKSQIFDNIIKNVNGKAIEVINNLITVQKQFMQKADHPDFQLQIQLGTSICAYIRLLIATKQFSSAQDILSQYFKQKDIFINDFRNIKGKQQLQQLNQNQKPKHIYMISGKLRLISTLANLTHQITRNSVDIFGILIKHIQHVYGSDSIQLSNIYFYAASYLNFKNQSMKALACYLKAAKLRKQLGGTAYYNVALILIQLKKKRKALPFFQKALQLIEKQKNSQNYYIVPQIYENIALIYLQIGNIKFMMDYFERAYYFYVRYNNVPKAEFILNFFILLKRQAKQQGSQDIKLIQFNHQKKQKKPHDLISTKNKQKFRNAQKITQEDQRKKQDWLLSFKDIKILNEPSQIKYPKQIQYLFGNQLNKNGQQQIASFLSNKSDSFGLSEGVNMDLAYMKELTSTQVGFLHELNRLLTQNKQSAAYHDIFQNSNFCQTISKQKLNKFYRLNPRLVRQTDIDRYMMLKIDEQEQENYQQPYMVSPKKPITPRLDLTKLKNN